MWNKKIVVQIIEQNIQKGDLEKAEEACHLAIKKGGLNKSDKQFIKKSFVKLSENHDSKSNIIKALVNSEYARSIQPYDLKILQNEMELFKKFIKHYENNFVSVDLAFLSIIITEITSNYTDIPQQNIYTSVVETGSQLIEYINSLNNSVSAEAESKLSYRIEKLLKVVAQAKYQNLSESERRERVSKYLGKALRRVGIRKKIITPRKE